MRTELLLFSITATAKYQSVKYARANFSVLLYTANVIRVRGGGYRGQYNHHLMPGGFIYSFVYELITAFKMGCKCQPCDGVVIFHFRH